jgi:hypothetical protein
VDESRTPIPWLYVGVGAAVFVVLLVVAIAVVSRSRVGRKNNSAIADVAAGVADRTEVETASFGMTLTSGCVWTATSIGTEIDSMLDL